MRIQPDGELHQENNRISFRISPNLEGAERYNYLLSWLTPKPQRAQDGDANAKEMAAAEERASVSLSHDRTQRETTPSIDSSGSQLDRSPSPTPMEGVEESSPAPSKMALPQGQAEATGMQDTVTDQTPDAAVVDGVEQDVRTSSRKMEKTSGEDQENVAMCTALAARLRDDSKMQWVPPKVTHEFTYPSDEEITPNPKASFKKTFLPRLGHVRSWFKGADDTMDSGTSTPPDEARTSAPCLPITAGKGSLSDGDKALALDTSPRRYIDIASRLPRDPEDLQHMADRAGVSTRLKLIAA